jgi:hypothetical protein
MLFAKKKQFFGGGFAFWRSRRGDGQTTLVADTYRKNLFLLHILCNGQPANKETLLVTNSFYLPSQTYPTSFGIVVP